MPQKFSTAADICRLVFLTTALSLLWSVEDMFGDPADDQTRKGPSGPEHTSL
ncbi:hypothetical protein LLH00_09780 [bacterium]|nr:hypothetical protein [bacterium]